MSNATQLEHAIRVLEPKTPLSPEQMSKYYMDRHGNPTNRLSVVLSNESGPTKIIFTGHRGSGKSTELNRLSAQVADKFFVVNYTVEGNLDLNDVDHVQILFSLAGALWKVANEQRLNLKSTNIKTIRDMIYTVTETEETETRRGMEAEAGLDVYIAKLSTKLKSEPATRKSFTKKVEPQISELLESLENIIKEIQRLSKKEVVIMIDGLDKPSVENAKQLFLWHGESLFSLGCKVVFTAPLALLYANEFSQIRHNVSSVFVLPNIPVNTIDGKPDKDGRRILRELLEKRVNPELLSKAALSALVEFSGGVVRELVMFAQGACVSAVAAGRSKVIIEDVREVLEEAKSNYRRILRDSHYRELIDLTERGKFRNSEIAQELLHNLSLLEYQSVTGSTWFALHPIVKSLLAEGQVLET